MSQITQKENLVILTVGILLLFVIIWAMKSQECIEELNPLDILERYSNSKSTEKTKQCQTACEILYSDGYDRLCQIDFCSMYYDDFCNK